MDGAAGREGMSGQPFDFGAFFRDMNILADLQLEERLWFDVVPSDAEPHDYVLYLGCNVLKTAHMVSTVLAILRLTGVDVVAVGGPANCCGTIHHQNGRPETARHLSERLIATITRLRPKEVLLWCPSCNHHLQTVVAPRTPLPFPTVHITEFLAARLSSLPLQPLNRVVALHRHGGLAQQDQDAMAAETLLAAIPGVQVVPSPVYPQLGVQCSDALVRKLGPERFAAIMEAYADAVVQQGADTLVTLYHACHRQLCRMEGTRPFKVESYVSLLGEALGIHHEDKYKRWALMREEDQIYEEAAPVALRKGIPEDRARQAIRQAFCG